MQSSLRPNGVKAYQRLYRERLKLEPFYELHLSRIRKEVVKMQTFLTTLFCLSFMHRLMFFILSW